MGEQHLLDLGRGDVLTTANDRVVGAALDEQVTAGVEPASSFVQNQPSSSSRLPLAYSPAICSPRRKISPASPSATALPSSSRISISTIGSTRPADESRRRTSGSADSTASR
jgi:hypothetical protein